MDQAVHANAACVTGQRSARVTVSEIAHQMGNRRPNKNVPGTERTAAQYRMMMGVTVAAARYNASAMPAQTGGTAITVCDARDVNELGV